MTAAASTAESDSRCIAEAFPNDLFRKARSKNPERFDYLWSWTGKPKPGQGSWEQNPGYEEATRKLCFILLEDAPDSSQVRQVFEQSPLYRNRKIIDPTVKVPFDWEFHKALREWKKLSDEDRRAFVEESLEFESDEDRALVEKPLELDGDDHEQTFRSLSGNVLIRRYSDIQPDHVDFLWHPYIPKAKLSLVQGDPEVGKGWLTLAIAAAVSRGSSLPSDDVIREPRNVLLVTPEDGPADTIRPRLNILGADVRRIFDVAVLVGNEETGLRLSTDGLEALREAVEALSPALLIIDPLIAVLDGKTDTNKATDVRSSLQPLANLAGEHDLAAIGVRHLNKGNSKAIYRGQGSIDFEAIARSVLLVAYDPCDKSGERRAMIPLKSSLTLKGPAQAFILKQDCFSWDGESTVTAEEMLSGTQSPSTEATQTKNLIKEQCRPLKAAEVAEKLKISTDAAKKRLARMVDRGELVRVTAGTYDLKRS